MKKFLYVFSALALLFASCSSDSDSSSNTDSGVILPKKMIQTYYLGEGVDDVITSNFTYNGNKLSTITYEGGDKEVVTYTGDLITKVEYLEGEVVRNVKNFVYDGQGRLLSCEDYLVASDAIMEKHEFTYNADGTVLMNYYSEGFDGLELMTSQKFYFENGEFYKRESINTWTGEVSPNFTTIVYDNKNNPFKNVLGYNNAFNMIQFEDSATVGFQRNLLTRDYDTDSGEFEMHWNFEYVYNSNNYPTNLIQHHNDLESVNVQFFYE